MSSRLRALGSACPYVFLVLSLCSGLFMAWSVPPFMNADELAHVHRADLLALGRVIGERVGTPQARVAGGMVDIPFEEAAKVFEHLQFHPDEQADAEDFAAARQARFDGRIKQTAFPGSATYPPVFYLPASATFALGKALRWPILDTLHLARSMNVLACALLGFLALRTAGRARLPLFALLLMPMSVSLFAAVSCDGLLLATTAMGVALVSRAIFEARPMTRAEVIWASVCFAFVAATKPPYTVFALTLFAAPGVTGRLRALAATIGLGLPTAWTWWMTVAVRTPARLPGTNVDPQAQAAHLAAHPETILAIAQRTLAEQWDFYARSFVGVLGWLDTPLPREIYPSALAILALAFLAAAAGQSGRAWARVRMLVPFQLALAGGGVFLSMYLLWTDVGLGVVNGVQGRYLLPLALFAALLVEGDGTPLLGAGRVGGAARLLAAWVVLVFPVVSLAVAHQAVLLRYYLD